MDSHPPTHLPLLPPPKKKTNRDKYFITKGKSPRNKAMSQAILAKNCQELSEENGYFTVNIMTIVKLVLEKTIILTC